MASKVNAMAASKMGRSTFNKSRAAPSTATPGGAYGRSTIGGKSVMSSRTNVSSRRSAGGEKSAAKAPPQVLDDEGNDVTPATLFHGDPVVAKGASKASVLGDTEAQSAMFGQSVFIGGQSFAAPFSRTGMGVSMTGSSYMQDDDIGGDTTALAGISQIQREHTHIAEVLTEDQLEGQVEIKLSETPTIFLLDIRGTAVASDSTDFEGVTARNEAYQGLLKNRAGASGNDSYVPRGMQTFNNPIKQKLIQTTPVVELETGCMATSWDMYDAYKAVEDAASKEGSEDADDDDIVEESPAPKGEENGTEPPAAVAAVPMDVASSGNESSRLSVSVLTESSVAFDDGGKGGAAGVQGNREKSAEMSAEEEKISAEAILNSPSLKDNLCIMERVVTRNIYQAKQALYRGFNILPDPDVPKKEEEADLSVLGPNVERLWTYGGVLTKCHNISCMTWNKSNDDILAVGYGEYGFTNQKSGMACCWSIKNPEYPERVFHTNSGITALDFSRQNPNLLAVGMYNGTISVYNVRSNNQIAILDSNETPNNHLGPVWEIKWIEREHHAGEDRSENIITTSTDGRVAQWMIRKGFESIDLMKLKRVGRKVPPPTEAEKAAAAGAAPGADGQPPAGHKLRGEAFISRFAGGLGFDYYPSNSNIYLVCTEEGYIHKCSCSYNEQYLQTYNGHTGPVYKVKWSPFVQDCFLTCGSDWTIRMWHADCTKPVLTFVSSTKSVNDICWSNDCATVFGAVSDNRIEIWDLRSTTLDPIIISPVTDPETRLSTFLFSENSNTLLVGDSSGLVTVYQLRNVAEPTHTHIQTLRDIVLPISSQHTTLSSTSMVSGSPPPDR